ncbi:MAG: sensor histidine kinase [Solirubrobacterales bacterium]
MSLRTRLVLALLALAAIGLVVLDLVSYTALHSYLSDRVDQQVESAIGPAIFALGNPIEGQGSGQAGQFPRPPKGVKPPEGGPPFAGDVGGPGGPQLPPGTYAIRLNGQNQVVQRELFSYGESGLAKPELPSPLPLSRSAAAPRLFTVPASDGSSPDFRAMAIRVPGSRGTIVVAVPLRELTQTLDRLRTIELIVSGAVLLALGVLAWLVIKAGLRPLERMGKTADAIAAGDLSRRVEPANQRTEVGRLGLALNGMLGQIELAFAEREASEERLRRFLADASHELRTPLSSIRGYAEIFRTGAARQPEQLAQAMRRIEDEAARMGGLVNDLLALARLDEVRESRREPLDLAALARGACDDARAQAPERRIALEVEGSAEILGDPEQLRQVLNNLLGNALKHTPAGIPIEVSLSGNDHWATLTVRDHGPGLEQGAEEQVFERFWREEPAGHSDGSGSGLGLAIVAAIAQAHGGRVEAANAAGGGAQFTVILPSRAAAEEPAPA